MQELYKKYGAQFASRQFINYAIIGLSGVFIDLIVFVVLHNMLHVPAIIATVISVSAGIVNNFFLNKNLNFKKRDNPWKRFASFYAVGAIGIVISALIIVLFEDVIGTSAIVAKLISVPVIVVTQYLFNKNISFAEAGSKLPVKQLVVFAVAMACLVVGAINGPHAYFSDEHDNLLGGRLITEGQVIYKDFFSHHMPLQYFVAVPFHLLFGTNLIASKVVFGILTTAWLLIFSRHIYKRYGLPAWSAFVGILTFTQMATWANMFLAESFTAYACLHLLVLFWCRRDIRFGWPTALTYAALSAIPILSSASFVWLSLLGYTLALIHGWSWLFRKGNTLLPTLRRLAGVVAVVAIPYVLLLAYLAANGALHDFKTNAFQFNTLYYSQFVKQEVGNSTLETIYLQITSLINGISTVLFEPQSGKFLLRTLLVVALAASMLLVAVRRRWTELTVLAVAFIMLGSIREGFINGFLPGRAGTILDVMSLGILCIYLFEIRRDSLQKLTSNYERAVGLMIIIFFGFVLLSTSSIFIKSIYEYRDGNSLVSIPDSPSNVDRVINTVNKPGDTYWVGPLDFYSQTQIPTHNASKYTFYLPWHAVCPDCKAGLISDLNANKPNAVYWEDAGAIFGQPNAVYGHDIKDFLNRDYYQISDSRLKFFYFRNDNRQRDNIELQKAGYAL